MGELLGIEGVPMWLDGLVVVVAMAVVGLGAHWVVDSAVRIAERLGISHLVIGLTVVAFGTSAPEFAVTLISAFKGQGDISVGNVVGSNIFNLGFIFGGCALVRAIPSSRTLLRRDGLVIGGTTLLLLVLVGWDLRLDRHDGALLFALLVVYLVFLFKQRKAEEGAEEKAASGRAESSAKGKQRSTVADVGLLLTGLFCIVGGSHVLVASATALARGFGVSEWVIAVTIVAAGTSTPEFATSLAGVIKGRYALSAGNVIGSDIFNMLGVLGLAGVLQPVGVDAAARVSLAALSGMVFLALLFMRTGWKVSRLEGLALVVIALIRWAFDFTTRAQ